MRRPEGVHCLVRSIASTGSVAGVLLSLVDYQMLDALITCFQPSVSSWPIDARSVAPSNQLKRRAALVTVRMCRLPEYLRLQIFGIW